MYITPRTLLAIIRISQAMAKFHFRDLVTQPDVDQAIKLMDYSFETLEKIHREDQKGYNRRDRKYKPDLLCCFILLNFIRKDPQETYQLFIFCRTRRSLRHDGHEGQADDDHQRCAQPDERAQGQADAPERDHPAFVEAESTEIWPSI